MSSTKDKTTVDTHFLLKFDKEIAQDKTNIIPTQDCKLLYWRQKFDRHKSPHSNCMCFLSSVIYFVTKTWHQIEMCIYCLFVVCRDWVIFAANIYCSIFVRNMFWSPQQTSPDVWGLAIFLWPLQMTKLVFLLHKFLFLLFMAGKCRSRIWFLFWRLHSND